MVVDITVAAHTIIIFLDKIHLVSKYTNATLVVIYNQLEYSHVNYLTQKEIQWKLVLESTLLHQVSKSTLYNIANNKHKKISNAWKRFPKCMAVIETHHSHPTCIIVSILDDSAMYDCRCSDSV